MFTNNNSPCMVFCSQQLNEYRVFICFIVTPPSPFFFPLSLFSFILFSSCSLLFFSILSFPRTIALLLESRNRYFSLRANNSIWRGQFSGNLAGCKFSWSWRTSRTAIIFFMKIKMATRVGIRNRLFNGSVKF